MTSYGVFIYPSLGDSISHVLEPIESKLLFYTTLVTTLRTRIGRRHYSKTEVYFMFLLSKQLYYCNLLNQVDWLYLHCTIVVSHTGLPRKDETSETFWALENLFIEECFLNYLIFPKSLLWQTVMYFRVHLSISFNKNLIYSNLCSVGLLVDWNLACYAYVDCTVHNAHYCVPWFLDFLKPKLEFSSRLLVP